MNTNLATEEPRMANATYKSHELCQRKPPAATTIAELHNKSSNNVVVISRTKQTLFPYAALATNQKKNPPSETTFYFSVFVH